MRILRWLYLAVVGITMLGCGLDDGGGEQPFTGESPWATPGPCAELFSLDFEAKGGDPRGTWLPIQLCSLIDGERLRVVGPTCEAELDAKVVIEDHLTYFWIGDGVCEAAGTGSTLTDTDFTPFECLPGEPEDTCVDPVHIDPPEPGGLDIKFGQTRCRVDDAAGACICERTDEWGAEGLFGRFPCSFHDNVMFHGSRNPTKFEFSVEGDYLIRRLDREPREAWERPDGSMAYNYYYGFQIFQRDR